MLKEKCGSACRASARGFKIACVHQWDPDAGPRSLEDLGLRQEGRDCEASCPVRMHLEALRPGLSMREGCPPAGGAHPRCVRIDLDGGERTCHSSALRRRARRYFEHMLLVDECMSYLAQETCSCCRS